MGLFTWLRRKMFGEAAKASTPAAAAPSAPAAAPSAPAAPVAPLSPEVLQQFQQMIQALSGADWYYERNQQNIGPFTLAQLQQLLAAGQLRGDDVVWRPGTARVPLSQVLPASFPPLPAAPAEAPVAPPPTSAPPAAASNSPDWFYAEDNKNRKGPFSLGQLRWMSQTGALGPTAMVWRQGLPRWVQLVSVEGMDFPLPRTPPSDEIRYTPATPIGPPPGSIEQAVEWYYLLPGYRGPSAVTSLAFIKSNVRTGQIDRNAMVWRYGLPGWVPMTSVAGITFPSVGTAPPPPPVSPPAASSAPAVSAPPRPAPAPAPPRAAPAPPRPGELQLEAGDFLPITQSDLKQQAKEMGTWSPWFGRRDLIPPADDVRTKLIDRALVSNGLLSPEQLIEIHTVGAEMDRVRPTLVNIEQQAYRSGEAAVQAERDRKARLKAEKKAESERRKKERAEAVARRKATDIVFLGRGVSKQLSDRTSDVAKLSALGLPVLATPAELAAALGLSVPRLRWLAFHAEVAARIHYVNFTVPKKSGGIRTLSAPHRTLAAAQQWVLDNIVGKLPAEPEAHGFLPGKSILTNAQAHTGKAVVVNVDLADFFPSITFPRVRSVFRRAGYSGSVATVLALLCTECPRRNVQYNGRSYHVAIGPRGLPQGACTSPGLSNQVARRLDRRLGGLAKKLGLTYTRYADDLTWSGPLPLPVTPKAGAGEHHLPEDEPDRPTGLGYLFARIRHIVEESGFRINHKKSRVLRQSAAQLVTGIVVNAKPSIRRKEIRRLRAILHRARREGLEAQNRERRPNFRAWLAGKIAFVAMVRPEIGAKLEAELRSLG